MIRPKKKNQDESHSNSKVDPSHTKQTKMVRNPPSS